jgi:hypothetical protein
MEQQQSDRAPDSLTSPWLNAEKAATYVGLAPRSIYRACAIGELRHIRINGKRELRTRVEWLDQWLERHAFGGDDAAPAATAHDVLTRVAGRQ